MANHIFASRLEDLEAEPLLEESFFQPEKEKTAPTEEEIYEGQLAVDVYQDEKNVYIKAAIAGIKAGDLDISLDNDTVTIRGKRQACEAVNEENYFVKECYWGNFSRSVILPVDIKQDQVRATIQNGILTIILPKSKRPRHSKIKVKEIKE